ncbi:3-dehydroquinate synthase [Alishewanella longhuensis]|uniref:3-dehydroquinate synthase n=1 Tax=Alishewanella longhuensis TaxID=1091037 RepID=A0ABQ3KUQ1_9ALTE|nr:3-dehydroquinate synthase [Alishewanella longhuensis]GHG62153.1 3-dehydroquinate synthase [Alishewanella longhuensis]
MQKVDVQLGERSYPIHIADEFSALIPELADAAQVVIISNPVVAAHYLEPVAALFPQQPKHFLLPDGEAYKTLASFEQVLSFLLEQKMSRDLVLVALGGGVIGDLTGFVAACYQRGVRFVQIPTTLLSQVDSSVGGKTAVNHPLGKNMIGAFKQPEQVIINTQVLQSLPAREFSAGMAEVVKYALLGDRQFIDWLLQHAAAIRQHDAAVLAQMIQHCCQMKADIVSRDETEQGERALLNLGHTFGHAIEAFMGYGTWLHGEAVAAGMVMAAKLAHSRGWLTEAELALTIKLLVTFDLPVVAPASMSINDFLPYMKADKKVKAGKMRFVLPTALGKSTVVADVTESELLQVFA